MANTIVLKRSSTASAVPATGSLAVGELAINLADRRLFSKNVGGAVINVTVDGTHVTSGSVAVANGGTGATTAAGALTNLGAPSSTGSGASGTWGISITGSSASCTGNAATVTNGVYSNTSYIDPAFINSLAKSKVGLSLVENTALSTWAGSANITTLGTIASGTVPAARVSGLAASATTDATNAANISSGTLPSARLTGSYAISVTGSAASCTGNSANVTGTVAVANGGTGATTAAAARTNLGATTAGSNIFTLANPSVTSFVRINADNTVTATAAIPQNSQTAAYTLVAADSGKHVSITTGGVTVPATVFAVGDAVTIFNNSATNQTITQGASVTLRLAGTATTGNRTLAQYGTCTLLCVASNVFAISGSGLT